MVARAEFKWPYGIALGVWSVTYAALRLADTFAELFGLRVVLGVVELVAARASLVYFKRNFGREDYQRIRVYGIFSWGRGSRSSSRKSHEKNFLTSNMVGNYIRTHTYTSQPRG